MRCHRPVINLPTISNFIQLDFAIVIPNTADVRLCSLHVVQLLTNAPMIDMPSPAQES